MVLSLSLLAMVNNATCLVYNQRALASSTGWLLFWFCWLLVMNLRFNGCKLKLAFAFATTFRFFLNHVFAFYFAVSLFF